MASESTFARLEGTGGQGPYAIPIYTPAGTSATVVTNQLGNPAILYVGNGSQLNTAAGYPSNFDGIPFRVAIYGKATAATTCNLTVGIALQSSSTYASGNLIATSGAIAIDSATKNFYLSATVMWNSTTLAVGGTLTGFVANTAVSAAALTNAVACTAITSLVFVPVLTFSDTTSGTKAYISEFVASRV